MKRAATALAGAIFATFALAAAGPASAQDVGSYVGTFSALADGMGQGVGQAISGSQSIFVYAQGHAAVSGVPAPAPGSAAKPETYQVQVSFSAPTAVEAAGKRDALLSQMRSVAQQFKAEMKTSEVSIVLGDPCFDPNQSMMMPCLRRNAVAVRAAAATQDMAKKPDDAAKQFSATAQVSFSMADLARAPAFLDALHAAGVESIGNMDDTPVVPTFLARQNSFAAVHGVGESVWDAAARDAVRAARGQAAVLAQADGRDVGEARQILFLARSVEGDQAIVTVAVRFDLTGSAKH